MIYFVISTMGSGKTLFSTLFAIQYGIDNPKNRIYANYNILRLNNFTYTKYGFLPFSEINNCLIILDDISAIKNVLSGLLQVIANASRKASIDIIITAQYYTMIPKPIRELGTQILVSYHKPIDYLYVAKENLDSNGLATFEYYCVDNAVKKAKIHYDTNEIVAFASEKEIIREVLNVSENFEDIEKNIEFLTNSTQKRKNYMKLAKGIASIPEYAEKFNKKEKHSDIEEYKIKMEKQVLFEKYEKKIMKKYGF